jgi:hypothetical protein
MVRCDVGSAQCKGSPTGRGDTSQQELASDAKASLLGDSNPWTVRKRADEVTVFPRPSRQKYVIGDRGKNRASLPNTDRFEIPSGCNLRKIKEARHVTPL